MMATPGRGMVARLLINYNRSTKISQQMFLRKFSTQAATTTTCSRPTLVRPLQTAYKQGKQNSTSSSLRCIFANQTRGNSTTADDNNSNNNHQAERRDFSALLLTTNVCIDGKQLQHVAHLQLNKPKSKNAFGFDSALELADALRIIEDDPTCRCLVLSGSGPNFTSGVDLKSFMTVYAQLQETQDLAHRAKLLRRTIERFQAPFKVMHAFSKPIVNVAHGLCYGLGMELAACSDIRYCSEDTKFSIREVLIGIAADVGSLQLMPKLVANQSLLRELIFTGRDLSLDEARELAFVSKVFSTKEEALAAAFKTAKTIASRSPLAVQGSKQNLRFSEDKPFSVGLDYNCIWNMAMMQGGDLEKAIAAILSRTDEVEFENF